MTESFTEEDSYDLDNEVLIALIEERPVLWDKTLETHKSKPDTHAAWREICVRLNPNIEQVSDAEKNKYGKILMKRWTNLRDRYIKYLKKVQEPRYSGSKAKAVKKYVYSEQMSFLRKNKNYPTSTSEDTQEEVEIDAATDDMPGRYDKTARQKDIHEPPPSKKRFQQKYTEIEKTLNKLHEKEDRHMHFFKGILPSLQILRDDEVIRFQSGVLNVLQDIHKTRQLEVANSYPGCDV